MKTTQRRMVDDESGTGKRAAVRDVDLAEANRAEMHRADEMDRAESDRAAMERDQRLPMSGADNESGTSVPARAETPHLADQASAQAGARWQEILAGFVDDPRRAVGDAHQLVGEVMQRMIDGFTAEREKLERQWSKGGDVSTEDLRVCLQNYRAFFARLLPAADR